MGDARSRAPSGGQFIPVWGLPHAGCQGRGDIPSLTSQPRGVPVPSPSTFCMARMDFPPTRDSIQFPPRHSSAALTNTVFHTVFLPLHLPSPLCPSPVQHGLGPGLVSFPVEGVERRKPSRGEVGVAVAKLPVWVGLSPGECRSVGVGVHVNAAGVYWRVGVTVCKCWWDI